MSMMTPSSTSCLLLLRPARPHVAAAASIVVVALILCINFASALPSIPAHYPVHKKLIEAVCNHTTYKSVCVDELSSFDFVANPIPKPLDLVAYMLRAAGTRCDQGTELAHNSTHDGGGGAVAPLVGQCAGVCVEVLEDAREQLRYAGERLAAIGAATASDLAKLKEKLVDVKVWLSSALSFQISCVDNFEFAPGQVQDRLDAEQSYLGKVIGDSICLIGVLSQVGNDLDKWLGPIPEEPPFIGHPGGRRGRRTRRRLLWKNQANSLTAAELGFREGDEFPAWVSAGDRRLLQSSASSVSANIVVAKDGSGDFTTVTAALAGMPSSYSGRFVIYIKAGVYNEVFNVSSSKKKVTFIGDGIGATIITGNRNVASGNYNTYRTSTVGIAGSEFYARDITFRNTAGPSGHQAVAVRAGADFLVFYRCSFEGYQDTLYALSSRQFYRECRISGTVDFIFGNAIAVFQNCVLLARLPLQGQQNTYTAQGRTLSSDISGYVFQGCTVTADSSLQNAAYAVSTYLGRPWKAYSRVVFMQSELQGLVDPAGWLPWNASNPFIDTLYYGEYDNTGGGAGTSGRVKWKGVHPALTTSEATDFTVADFIAGDTWIDAYGVPYKAGL